MTRRIPAVALLCGLLAPASAAAQDPAATPAPSLHIDARDTLRDGKRNVVVAGRAWRLEGALTPYVAGERVTIAVYRNGRRIHRRREALVPSADGTAGTFGALIRRGRPGSYTVQVTHPATPALGLLRSNPVHVRVVDGNIGFGQRGVAVRLLQRGLARLHYAVPRSGVYDDATGRAVMAWRKVSGRPRTFTASREVLLGVLARRGAWKVRHPRDGRHAEADISRQVLALVRGSRVLRIYHMSSGAPATPTILGRFRVYLKTPGTNAKGMVHSSYFRGGYAVHGYASVPPFNASHGCLRVPIPDSWSIYSWLRMGTVVWVEP